MPEKNIFNLALKIMGIYILSKAILYIPGVVTMLPQFLSRQPVIEKTISIAVLITFLLLLALGLWLMLKKNKNDSHEELKLETSVDFTKISIALAGIIICSLVLADLPFLISQLFSNPDKIPGLKSDLESMTKGFGKLIQLALGLLLFFRAKFFAKFLQ